jgi:hypothetical protein
MFDTIRGPFQKIISNSIHTMDISSISSTILVIKYTHQSHEIIASICLPLFRVINHQYYIKYNGSRTRVLKEILDFSAYLLYYFWQWGNN